MQKALNTEINPQILDVADKIGLFIEYWGFKKVHGRIWAMIFLAEAPVDANYLIRTLGISKASVSISLKELLQYRVIIEEPHTQSTVHYSANKDIANVILDVLMNREAKMLLEIKSSCEILDRMNPSKFGEYATEDRVSQLLAMTDFADAFLKSFLTMKSVNLGGFKDSLSLQEDEE